jgi:hypothetical protein
MTSAVLSPAGVANLFAHLLLLALALITAGAALQRRTALIRLTLGGTACVWAWLQLRRQEEAA